MNTVVFGIKNCDTVKKARKWLEQHHIDYEFTDFREQPLNANQVREWVDALGLDTLVNRRSTTYRQLQADVQKSADIDTWVNLIIQQPTLIKRPLLSYQGSLYCGFKDTHYKEVFDV